MTFQRQKFLIKIQDDLHHQQIHHYLVCRLSTLTSLSEKITRTINIKEADFGFPYEMTYSSRFNAPSEKETLL